MQMTPITTFGWEYLRNKRRPQTVLLCDRPHCFPEGYLLVTRLKCRGVPDRDLVLAWPRLGIVLLCRDSLRSQRLDNILNNVSAGIHSMRRREGRVVDWFDLARHTFQ
jgi:hypothetical protein